MGECCFSQNIHGMNENESQGMSMNAQDELVVTRKNSIPNISEMRTHTILVIGPVYLGSIMEVLLLWSCLVGGWEGEQGLT